MGLFICYIIIAFLNFFIFYKKADIESIEKLDDLSFLSLVLMSICWPMVWIGIIIILIHEKKR